MALPQGDNPLIVALDTTDVGRALDLARRLQGQVGCIKVGLRLYLATGPKIVETLKGLGYDVFLDLKFHDIPSQVAAACRRAVELRVKMFTLHVSGGLKMLEAALTATGEAAAQLETEAPLLLGVTVLTSLSKATVRRIFGRELPEVLRTQVSLAQEVGLPGLVVSPLELAEIRRMTGPEMVIVTPGIRPDGSRSEDQERVLSPPEALRLGADYLVVGRPIIEAPDPVAACRRVIDSLARPIT